MKKILKGLVLAGVLASSLSAAKVATPDEFGRLYNTAYFDIKTDKQSPVLDIIGYSKRIGTFDWSKLYNSLSTVDADKIEFKISTRIEVPQDIKTNDVYVTTGKNVLFQHAICCNYDSLENTSMTKSNGGRSVYLFKTLVNEQEIKSGNGILAKTKSDSFGNKYVDINLVFLIDITDNKSYYPTVKANLQKSVKNHFDKFFSAIKIKVAPKSRTFQSKWVEPKIYVLDE